MFVNVNNHRAFPCKQEVPGARAQCHGNAEICVVSHEYQHKKVTNHDL